MDLNQRVVGFVKRWNRKWGTKYRTGEYSDLCNIICVNCYMFGEEKTMGYLENCLKDGNSKDLREWIRIW